MIDSILNQLKVKFGQLQGLVLTNYISKETATQQASKLIFTANIVIASLNQESEATILEKIQLLEEFKRDVKKFRNMYDEIYNDVEVQPELVEELRANLPETIHSDSFKQDLSL